MAMFKVNNVNVVKDPSSMEWGRARLSSEDSGRTQTGLMQMSTIADKVTINLSWLGCTHEEVHAILSQFTASDFFTVTYCDPVACATASDRVTKTFYVGDLSAPVHMWTDGKKMYNNVSFKIIER